MNNQQLNGLVGQLSPNQGMQNYGTRQATVWVACRDGDPIAAFPTKALADIFMTGVNAVQPDAVVMTEMPITWAS